MTITVHNSNELHTALKNATGGETIALAKGDYGWIGVSYKNFDVPVTITSADPDSPTTLPERMIVQHSSGVIFKILTLPSARMFRRAGRPRSSSEILLTFSSLTSRSPATLPSRAKASPMMILTRW